MTEEIRNGLHWWTVHNVLSNVLRVYFMCLWLQCSTQPCEVTIIIPVFRGLGELLLSLQSPLAKTQGTRILTRVWVFINLTPGLGGKIVSRRWRKKKKKKGQEDKKTRVSLLSPLQNCENEGTTGVNPTVQAHRKTSSARLTGSLEPSGFLLFPGPFYLSRDHGWLVNF